MAKNVTAAFDLKQFAQLLANYDAVLSWTRPLLYSHQFLLQSGATWWKTATSSSVIKKQAVSGLRASWLQSAF